VSFIRVISARSVAEIPAEGMLQKILDFKLAVAKVVGQTGKPFLGHRWNALSPLSPPRASGTRRGGRRSASAHPVPDMLAYLNFKEAIQDESLTPLETAAYGGPAYLARDIRRRRVVLVFLEYVCNAKCMRLASHRLPERKVASRGTAPVPRPRARRR
jgi:hypothetical protein